MVNVKLKPGDLISYRSGGPERALLCHGPGVKSIDVRTVGLTFIVVDVKPGSPGVCLRLYCARSSDIVMMWYSTDQIPFVHEFWDVHCALD